MARPRKFTKEEIVDALKKAHGLKTGAAELLGVTDDTVAKYCARYPDAEAVVDHWRKRRKDRAEYKLDEAIERGESWAIMFTLKNAHDREYNERVSISAQIETIEAYDYGIAIAALAPRSVEDRSASGEGESVVHGTALREDAHGG